MEEKEISVFSKRLIELRKNSKMTQRDVAKAIGITQPSYIRYEKGTAEPSINTLIKLTVLFDVSADYLIGKEAF